MMHRRLVAVPSRVDRLFPVTRRGHILHQQVDYPALLAITQGIYLKHVYTLGDG